MNLLHLPLRLVRSLYFILFISSIIIYYFFLPIGNELDKPPQQKNNLKKIALNIFNKFPMRFEKNMGQAEFQTDFLFSDNIFELFLSPNIVKMSLRQQTRSEENTKVENITMQLANANPFIKVEGIYELITKSNYFIGNDSTKWHTNVPNYERIKYNEVYPGIDLVYYGKVGKLEYDFNIFPESDPKVIQLQFEKDANVKLEVYDILGNEVAELVNEPQSSANYKYTFDAQNYQAEYI
ncbi:MAG: hypothetical protein GY936_14570 [Ignavibacteriae bacterium]|nr:hypothetical protein [Ignavibacteriota bacterium]